MAETIACLKRGKLELLVHDRGDAPSSVPLASPYQERAGTLGTGLPAAPIVSVTRGRRRGELYYAIDVPSGTAVFAQTHAVAQEEQIFHGVDVKISEIDFSFGDEALACRVPGPRGTSAIGSLADDGKGVRTVTEGDVVDCMPRWAIGGRGEIVYASAGVGRTKSGKWGGLSPFSLHRLRFTDNSVEVLTADAKYDYLAPVPISDSLLYAIRRPYRAPRPPSPLELVLSPFRRKSGSESGDRSAGDPAQSELVRITTRGIETLASGVVAFDVAMNGDVVYVVGSSVLRLVASVRGSAERTDTVATLADVDQLVIC